MDIRLSDNGCLSFDLSKKNKKYRLNANIKSKYINYEVYSKIRYDELISIIESIESMIFRKHRYISRIELDRMSFDFVDYETKIRFTFNLGNNQEYSIILKRDNIIKIYNYLTKFAKTFNKMNMMDFNRKYTYVEVRYIDVYCSRLYSYISEDKNVKIGDIVYVDRAGNKCLAVVENKNDYYYEEAPYPVLETKRVIKIVTKVEQYKY